MPHNERHRNTHIGWLRASVLGANDGLISTSSLIIGVAAAHASSHSILITGLAGLVAGSLSMAAGEYVSVSSQADTERADMAKERRELASQPASELAELTAIYAGRGLTNELAAEVAKQLTVHDGFAAHLRDELGISPSSAARPLQAALSSALAFAVGATPPVLLTAFWPYPHLSAAIMAITLVLLVGLGALAARVGGAPAIKGAARVLFWGAVAMGATSLIGNLFGNPPIA